MSESIVIALPPEVFDHLVIQITDRVRAELSASSPWMTRPEAADYLRVPLSRLEKDRTVPCHRWDGRVLYSRNELDAWMETR